MQEKAIKASRQRGLERQIEQERLKQWLVEHTIEEFLRIFGEKPTIVEISGMCAEVTHKGMYLQAARFYSGVNLRLIGICPECRAICISNPIKVLADVGDLIRRFRPGRTHICRRTSERSVHYRKGKIGQR